MKSEMVPFDPTRLAASLKKAAKSAAPMSSFLNMSKGGDWTYGVNGVEVEPDAECLVVPDGFVHGYVAWADTTTGASAAKLDEVMVAVDQPMPDEPDELPKGAKSWQSQLGMSLLLVSENEKLVYSTTSVGGKRAVASVASEVADKLIAGDPKCVPVVVLASESYKHKQYGKITNPIFHIVRWVEMPRPGQTAAEVAAPKKPAPKLPPAKAAAKKTR